MNVSISPECSNPEIRIIYQANDVDVDGMDQLERIAQAKEILNTRVGVGVLSDDEKQMAYIIGSFKMMVITLEDFKTEMLCFNEDDMSTEEDLISFQGDYFTLFDDHNQSRKYFRRQSGSNQLEWIDSAIYKGDLDQALMLKNGDKIKNGKVVKPDGAEYELVGECKMRRDFHKRECMDSDGRLYIYHLDELNVYRVDTVDKIGATRLEITRKVEKFDWYDLRQFKILPMYRQPAFVSDDCLRVYEDFLSCSSTDDDDSYESIVLEVEDIEDVHPLKISPIDLTRGTEKIREASGLLKGYSRHCCQIHY